MVARLRDVAKTELRLGHGLVGSWIGRALTISLDKDHRRYPGGGGGGIAIKTVRITSITTDHYVCKDFDDAGAVIGDPFDVYPRVFSAGAYITTGYNLNATTGTVVLEKFAVNSYLDIWASAMVLRRAAGPPPPARLYTVDLFHLSSCIA